MNKKQLEKSYHSALVYVTKRCNLSCPRCFLRGLSKEIRNYSMTKEQFVRIIKRLKEQNINIERMIFTGGEPTLWPHLAWAVKYAKESGFVKNTRIATNAVDREAEDYGDADIVSISHYGALNRYDIMRLRKQLGKKRCKIQYIVHLPWPFLKTSPKALPANCGCVALGFVGDRVYPCGFAAGQEIGDWVNIEEPFYKIFMGGEPLMQNLCRMCLSNRQIRKLNMLGLTFEFGIWDSAICFIKGFSLNGIWLRKLYRYYKNLKKCGF